MKVRLFSNGSHADRGFAALKRSRKYDLDVHEPHDPREALKSAGPGEFVYLDVSHLDGDALVPLARKLQKVAVCPFGFVHAGEHLEDPSRVFFAGASDFVGPAVLERGVNTKRMDEVVAFAQREGMKPVSAAVSAAPAVPSTVPADEALFTAPPPPDSIIVSGTDWERVEPSHEYTFWLLFAELDNVSDYVNHASEDYTTELVAAFRTQLTEAFAPYGGQVWIWKKVGGIILFPFDGESCAPIVPLMRFVLNRAISNVEDYNLKSELSYRLALHLGNTVFQNSGRTGAIVSETVNFIFHLGRRYLSAGEIAMTAEAAAFLPGGLRPYFRRGEPFEGHDVARLRRFAV